MLFVDQRADAKPRATHAPLLNANKIIAVSLPRTAIYLQILPENHSVAIQKEWQGNVLRIENPKNREANIRA